MANDATEIVIAKNGTIHSALLGASLPALTDPRATLTGYDTVGYYSEDGVALSNAPDILEVVADQAARPVRREAQMRAFTATFGLLQWNSQNLLLSFGGGRVRQTAAGVVRYDPPADEDPLDEVTLVIDWEDKGYEYRIIHERGNVTEATETTLSRRSAALLPVTYSGLDGTGALKDQENQNLPWVLVTDDPNFSPES